MKREETMRRTNHVCIAALLAALFAGAGCQKHIETPADFAEMEDPGYGFEYRAISSDEVVIGVQKKPNEPRGDAAFWKDVWKDKYPPIKDYEYVSDEKISTDGGLQGYLLEYTRYQYMETADRTWSERQAVAMSFGQFFGA